MMKKYLVSIVLPLYKPKGHWMEQFVENVGDLNSFLSKKLSVQYIVVHDGPADESVISAFHLVSKVFDNIQFISYHQNKGKGHALREGVKQASTPFVLMIDFDFPYQKENIRDLIDSLFAGFDVVVGKRSKQYFSQLPLKRKFISKAYSFLNRLFFDLPTYDTQSGIKGFNEKGKDVFLSTTINRFLVDTEFLLCAYKNNLSIRIINIHLKPHISFSNFGMQVIKTEMNNFLKLISINKELNHASQLKRA